ncbi:hypothetical protein HY029_00215 [Candidatus Gottesmanbacteria bacterium]|nr:hypothetical protein [Candidatus Gottesmanbacteria bacterium]
MPAKKSRKSSPGKNQEYISSPVVRVGLVFFFVMVIVVVAYVVKVFTP